MWEQARADSERATGAIASGDLLFGRYRVGELLAEGGQSLVWRLEDERLKRAACAKVLHRSAIEASVLTIVERGFLDEAFLLSRLTHPAALQIYDFGVLPAADDAPGVPVQICELVEQGPLSAWVRRHGALPPSEVRALVPPLAGVLAELHGGGVVHLDVKPQNILVRDCRGERHPKLADYGIARPIGSSAASDRGVLMYSVNWAAPEQLVGEPVGPFSDVYALGLVVVHALTGRALFAEPDPDQGYRLRRYAHELLAEALAAAGLPATVTAVLQDACRFEPEARIADVTTFARRLGTVLEPLADRAAADRSGTTAVGASDASRAIATPVWSVSLDGPSPVVAGRKLQLVALNPSADVNVAAGAARLRLSWLASSGEQCALHVKGLNCFVGVAGGRPSPALTLEGRTALELYSGRGQRLTRADVAFAMAGPRKSVVTVGGERLVIAAGECPVVLLDFGREDRCYLAYAGAPVGA